MGDTSGKYKGGSYPNHPSMRYELPIPFTPLGPPSNAYRDGWDRVFGPKDKPAEEPLKTSGFQCEQHVCRPWACVKCIAEEALRSAPYDVELGCYLYRVPPDAARVQDETPVQVESEMTSADQPGYACEVCGETGYHRLDRGLFACELES